MFKLKEIIKLNRGSFFDRFQKAEETIKLDTSMHSDTSYIQSTELSYIKLEIYDTGIGIEQDNLKSLSGMFKFANQKI